MKLITLSLPTPIVVFLTCFIFLVLVSCRPDLPPAEKVARPSSTANPSQVLNLPPVPGLIPTNKPPTPNPSEATDPISDVLSADLTPGETSSRLLSLLPSTPADDKSFLVQIAGNYCPDEEYWRLLPLLLDRSQPEDVRDELMRDVLRRPDAVRLRPLYRLALDPTHPLSTEAREYLFSYLQDVPENDFNALAKAVERAERDSP